MRIHYTGDPLPAHDTPTIFLAGPTAREGRTPWRLEAIDVHLREAGWDGAVVVPEFQHGDFARGLRERGWDRPGPSPTPGTKWSTHHVLSWETAGIDCADAVLFWMPLHLSDGPDSMPGFTTRVEFARELCQHPRRIAAGMPLEADLACGWLRYHAHERGVVLHATLRDTVLAAVGIARVRAADDAARFHNLMLAAERAEAVPVEVDEDDRPTAPESPRARASMTQGSPWPARIQATRLALCRAAALAGPGDDPRTGVFRQLADLAEHLRSAHPGPWVAGRVLHDLDDCVRRLDPLAPRVDYPQALRPELAALLAQWRAFSAEPPRPHLTTAAEVAAALDAGADFARKLRDTSGNPARAAHYQRSAERLGLLARDVRAGLVPVCPTAAPTAASPWSGARRIADELEERASRT